MNIIVRYSGATKARVVMYEIFADDLRIGFAKTAPPGQWIAVDWLHRFVDKKPTRRAATDAVIQNYRQFTETASKRNLHAFHKHAIRLHPNHTEKREKQNGTDAGVAKPIDQRVAEVKRKFAGLGGQKRDEGTGSKR